MSTIKIFKLLCSMEILNTLIGDTEKKERLEARNKKMGYEKHRCLRNK